MSKHTLEQRKLLRRIHTVEYNLIPYQEEQIDNVHHYINQRKEKIKGFKEEIKEKKKQFDDIEQMKKRFR